MKTYRMVPERTQKGGFLVLVDEGSSNIKVLDPKQSQKVYNHSPTGFNWGYGGSGPAQLALGLLLDVTDNKELSLLNYQDFKWKVVASHPMGIGWTITENEIEAWLNNREKGVLC